MYDYCEHIICEFPPPTKSEMRTNILSQKNLALTCLAEQMSFALSSIVPKNFPSVMPSLDWNTIAFSPILTQLRPSGTPNLPMKTGAKSSTESHAKPK